MVVPPLDDGVDDPAWVRGSGVRQDGAGRSGDLDGLHLN